jgi:SAM-dependent methyltransferase
MDEPTAFTQIAPHYDRLMSDVDYDRWLRYLESLLKLTNTRTRRVLDLACGSGTLSRNLAKRGYEVIGLDLSEPMLDEARAKQDGLCDLSFVRGDMRDFHLEEPVDAVFCIFDSLNYLLKESELRSAFRCVQGALRPGGAFLFDLNTTHCLKSYWGTKTQIKRSEGMTSTWRTRFDAKANLSTLTITLAVPMKGRTVEVEEVHRERAYDNPWVIESLHDAGFETVYAFDHLTQAPPHPDSLRITYLAA